MVGRAVRAIRRLDMDRRAGELGVEDRVGGSQRGSRPDVEQTDARDAEALQMPWVRSPNEQVAPPTLK